MNWIVRNMYTMRIWSKRRDACNFFLFMGNGSFRINGLTTLGYRIHTGMGVENILHLICWFCWLSFSTMMFNGWCLIWFIIIHTMFIEDEEEEERKERKKKERKKEFYWKHKNNLLNQCIQKFLKYDINLHT